MKHRHWRRWRWQNYQLPADLQTRLAEKGLTVILSQRCDRDGCDQIRVQIEGSQT